MAFMLSDEDPFISSRLALSALAVRKIRAKNSNGTIATNQAAIVILGLLALFLQIYILLRPRSSHYCGQPLLYNLVGSIVFTFFTVGTYSKPSGRGLALLLVTMEPLTGELKIIFSIFGMGSFVEGVGTAILTSLAAQCVAFFSVLGLFWFADMASPGLVLNKQAKSGICYGPVSECSCLWHV
ncbi:UNVERIFIED_CONTAM: hypothetical protein K2H54_005726 [Gekko kuhli]